MALPFRVLPFGVLPFGVLPFLLLPFLVLPFLVLPFRFLPFRVLPTCLDKQALERDVVDTHDLRETIANRSLIVSGRQIFHTCGKGDGKVQGSSKRSCCCVPSSGEQVVPEHG